MKTSKTLTILLLLSISFLTLQISQVKADSTMQITSVTPSDPWGNINYNLYRGYSLSLILEINSSSSGEFFVSASLFDNCQVPVAYTQQKFALAAGTNTISLPLNVAKYAYVGLGELQVIVHDLNGRMAAHFEINVYITILGDFNSDQKVNSSDTLIFAATFADYCISNSIQEEFKVCDINGDGVLDFKDTCAFTKAYISFCS